MSDAANILYGGSSAAPSSPSVAPAPANSTPVSMAARLYQSNPAPAPMPAPMPATQPAIAATPNPANAPAAPQPTPAADSNTEIDTGDEANSIAAPVDYVPDTPQHILDERNTVENRMYRNAQEQFAEALPNEFFQYPELTPEGNMALAAEVREMAADMLLTPADIPMIDSAMQNIPQTQEQVIAMREQAVEWLNAEYGEGATDALNLAREYLRQDPRRAAVLQQIGDHPDVVMRIVALARQARMQGKL